MLEFINDNIVSLVTPVMLIAVGLYFSLRLRLFYVRHPIKIIRSMCERKKGGGISPFRAVTLALAGTLGVGNIAGVASSIAIGGYGSVFWMWVSALVAMVLKYAEIVLAVNHRRYDMKSGEYRGGAAYYIEDYFSSKGKRGTGRALGIIFTLLCVVNSVTMGCVIQSNAVSTSLLGVAGIKQWIVGIVVALLSCIVISGSAKWISAFSEKTVPVMTLSYLVLSVAVLIIKREMIPDALRVIFEDAFSLKSAAGGAFGFLLSRALKAGVMRGLMSNEAGCGTAPTAHASADTDSAVKQGFWGIFEVFVDTILLCTLTALVIIVAGESVFSYSADPMMMAIKAFSSVLGEWSEYFMCLSVFLFAFATITCWAHYGKESLAYISGKKLPVTFFVLIFTVFVFIGAMSAPAGAWLAADLALGIMTVINLIVLCLMRREIIKETESFFKKQDD